MGFETNDGRKLSHTLHTAVIFIPQKLNVLNYLKRRLPPKTAL